MTVALRCPACGESMIAAPISHRAFACTGCGGVWADKAAALRIEKVADDELVDLADLASSRGNGEAREDGRTCPECGKNLIRERTAKTDLDVCKEHGTWFDKGELQRVAERLEKRRQRKAVKGRTEHEEPPAPKSTSGSDFDWSALEGVAAVVEIAANVLAAIA